MVIIIDNGRRVTVKNSVRLIIKEARGIERHITVTVEGIIEDIVERGRVVDTASVEHESIVHALEE